MEPEDFINQEKQSVLRNPIIADMLYRTKDIEKWGSGLKRIYDECKEKGVKVEFNKMQLGFKIIFYRREEFSETMLEGTQKGTQKILELIKQDKRITRSELAEILELSNSAIKKHLRNLKKKGKLRRVGPDKGGHWELVDNN